MQVPKAPFQLRVHQGEPGLRSAAERLSYALNDNFRAFVADELQADEAADLTEACQAYLEHRQAHARVARWMQGCHALRVATLRSITTRVTPHPTHACPSNRPSIQQAQLGAAADDRLRVRAVYCGAHHPLQTALTPPQPPCTPLQLLAPPALQPRIPPFAGAYHSFLLTHTENVYACGLNNMGQLGIGSLEPNFSAEPMLVEALEGKGVVQLSGGEHHSLALTEEGQVYAFGRGDSSQLGLGDGADQHLSPAKVEGLADVRIRKVTSGSNQNFAVAKSGDLYSWGFGEMGQLGNAREGDEHTPFLVEPPQMSGLATLDAASGGQHSVLLCMQGE